jgi:putative transposase
MDRNPVRSRMVRHAWDYQRSSARHHVVGEADPLLNEPAWLMVEMRKQKYRSYLRDEPEEAALEIRRTTATGRPLGSAAFLSTLESRLDRVIGVKKRGRPRSSAEK